MGRDTPYQPMFRSEAFVGAKEIDEMDLSSYRLVVTGHSLGACMASILTLLLRPRFPQARCVAFSPAAAIFSRELADSSASWCDSFIVGKDIFPRLCWRTAKELRNKLLDALRRSKTNKTTALASLVKETDVGKLMYPPQAVPQDDFRAEIGALLEKATRLEPGNLLDKIDMFIPGKVLHLAKTHTTRDPACFGMRTKAKRHYAGMWVRDRADLGEVQLSARLILDHMPDHVANVIGEVLRDVENDRRDGVVAPADNPAMMSPSTWPNSAPLSSAVAVGVDGTRSAKEEERPQRPSVVDV